MKALRVFSDQMAAMGIERTASIAVALSGGPDSLALALCSSLWMRNAELSSELSGGSTKLLEPLVSSSCQDPRS